MSENLDEIVLYKDVKEKFIITEVEDHMDFSYPSVKAIDIDDMTFHVTNMNNRNFNCYKPGVISTTFWNKKVPSNHCFKLKNKIVTDDKSTLNKAYGNPLCDVSIQRTTILITKKEDKLRLQYFNFNKQRKIGHKYYSNDHLRKYIIFNLKTNQFFTSLNIKSRRISLNKIQKNYFNNLNNHLDLIIGSENEFVINNTLKKELGLNNGDIICGTEINDFTSILNMCILWFAKNNNVKLPNHYKHYISRNYPGIKLIRKNDGNLIKAIQEKYNIKEKLITKYLNKYPAIDVRTMKSIIDTFGFNRFTLINPDIFNFDFTLENISDFDDNEHLNIINLMNDKYRLKMSCDPIEINDHIKIIKYLRDHNNPVRFKADTNEKFVKEHEEYSIIHYNLSKHITIIRKYEPEFEKLSTTPIVYNDRIYYPYLLQNDKDYYIEGRIQNHCVYGYRSQQSSIIVSIRRDDINSTDRVTCEFVHGTEMHLIQQRMKFNANPDPDFAEVVQIYIKTIHQYLKKNKPGNLLLGLIEVNKSDIDIPVNINDTTILDF